MASLTTNFHLQDFVQNKNNNRISGIATLWTTKKLIAVCFEKEWAWWQANLWSENTYGEIVCFWKHVTAQSQKTLLLTWCVKKKNSKAWVAVFSVILHEVDRACIANFSCVDCSDGTPLQQFFPEKRFQNFRPNLLSLFWVNAFSSFSKMPEWEFRLFVEWEFFLKNNTFDCSKGKRAHVTEKTS